MSISEPLDTVIILLVEDSPQEERRIKEILSASENYFYIVESAVSLEEAGPKALSLNPHVILLERALTGERGITGFYDLLGELRTAPVIVLTDLENRNAAFEMVRAGAADFLVKEYLDIFVLEKSVFYAVERSLMQEKLKALSVTDELTELYNRRGFEHLAEQAFKIHKRHGGSMALFSVDIKGLKEINGKYGRHEGDRALKSIAGLLKRSCRDSDIVSRFRGGEFVILGIEIPEQNADNLRRRILEKLERLNESGSFPYPLALSIGFSSAADSVHKPLAEMISEASVMCRENSELHHR